MDPLTLAAISGGSELLSGLGSYLLGGADRKYKKRLRNEQFGLLSSLKSELGNGLPSAQSYLPALSLALAPQANAAAANANRRVGFGSGIGQSIAAESQQGAVSSNLLNLLANRDANESSRRRDILSMLSSLTSQRVG